MDSEMEKNCTAYTVSWITRKGETPAFLGSYATREEAEEALARFAESNEGHGEIIKYYTCCPGMC